jgi:sarcosine oxidase subunit gamma
MEIAIVIETVQTQQGEGDMIVRRESPLHYAVAEAKANNHDDAGIVFHEQAHLGHLNLRGDPEDDTFCRGVAEVLGVDLPLEPGSFTCSSDNRLYWLGPTEWLAIVAVATEAEVEAKLRQTLTGHFSVVDVSGGQTLINLSGDAVGMVLKKSSGYDFQSGQFTQGRCVQTTFAKASGLVGKTADNSFDLVIRRSFSDYLFKWIVDAASEYGLEVHSERPSGA